MKKLKVDGVAELVNVAQYAAVPVQPDDILKWVQLGLAIACSVVLLAYRIWSWWKKAKADGKIDKEEAKEVIGIVKDGLDDIKDKIDNKEEK